MPAPADLVYQQTTGTGTGDLALTTVAGKRTFASAFGTGNTNTFDYFISSKAASEWEIGVGYIDATTGDLVRNTVSLSSNSNLAVNFGAGTKDITNDIKAADQVRGAGTVTNNHAVLFDGTSGSLIKSAGFGLGSIASQAANNVSITGGSISGITDLAIADGGTNASTQADAISNVGGALVKSLYDLTGTVVSGDVLYGSAANTLARLAKATNGNVLKLASGLPSWAAPFSVNVVSYTSTPVNPYTPSTGLIAALIICTGAGGGGGSGTRSTAVVSAVAAGGGGAGGTGISFLSAATIGASRTVTVGTGGAGGANGGNGGNGTATSFGTLIVANGGLAGNGTSASTSIFNFGAGGNGGIVSAGQLGFNGGAAGDGSGAVGPNIGSTSATSGAGGASFWGGGGPAKTARNASATGLQSNNFGGGGSGGAAVSNNSASVTGAGGAGAGGVVVIFEFISA